MSDDTKQPNQSSDWFREAIGDKPTTPSPTEELDLLAAENAPPPEPKPETPQPAPTAATVTLIRFDGDPGTSTSSFDPIPVIPDTQSEPEATAVMPAPKARTKPTPPPPPVQDEALAKPLRSRRTFRWPVVAVLGLAIVAIGVAAAWLPRAAKQEAMAVRQAYYDAAADVRNYLPTAQTGLDAITNPASEPSDVSGAVAIVTQLDSVSLALEQVTAQPLPSVLPLVPSGPIDALGPLQDRGSILGAASSLQARRMANAYVYRTSTPILLDPGSLPPVADTQQINEISVRLASSLAADAAVIADLPDDPSFESLKTLIRDQHQRYGAWQNEYLDALTGEDADAANALLNELDAMTSELNASTQSALLAFRSETDIAIVDLAGELEAYMADLTRGQ